MSVQRAIDLVESVKDMRVMFVGDQIIDEAKIIAIADVVEAITSHRPYRPAHGIEEATGEIERGRGSAYDPAMVDVCLMLISSKRFAFSH